MNEEAGATWLSRMTEIYDKTVWLNPVPRKYWDYTPSIAMIEQLMGGRMFELTLDGLEQGIRALAR
jgi:uncharacterized protein with von Willebrand factor type A (vWA) domain